MFAIFTAYISIMVIIEFVRAESYNTDNKYGNLFGTQRGIAWIIGALIGDACWFIVFAALYKIAIWVFN